MLPRCLWLIASVFVVAVALPRVANAGIGEFIWEMSGPSMVGFPVECRVGLVDGEVDICTFLGIRLLGNGIPERIPERKIWLFLEGGPYFSNGKNASGVAFDFGDEFMVTFDPMVAFRTVQVKPDAKQPERFSMYHGIMGMSYNFMVGPNFKSFSNVAFKLRPVGLSFRARFNIEYNVRIYPNGFEAGDFGKVPSALTSGRAELVQGVTAFYIW